MSSADPLILGLTAEELWPVTNVALIPWMLLVFVPRWQHTPFLTAAFPLLLCFVYTASLIGYFVKTEDQVDFISFEGVVKFFKDSDAVFVGWIHYLAYDALVGRWCVIDSIDRGAGAMFHMFVMVPILYLCLMCGPVGCFLYVALIRPLFLPQKGSGNIVNDGIKGD